MGESLELVASAERYRNYVLASAGEFGCAQGLFSVDTVEEAADAIRAVRLDYPAHAKAAREIAVEHFDSDRILRPLLREAGIESPRG